MNPTLGESAFDRAIEPYLQTRRALGRGYGHEERVIDALRRFLKKGGFADLDRTVFEAWCASQTHLAANTRRTRQRIVRNFCLYRERGEPACFIPDINRFPRRCPPAPPVIFGPTEVARMLVAAKTLAATKNSPLRPAVMRLAVVLLYTAGLRRGELVRLTLEDVDPRYSILRIRESRVPQVSRRSLVGRRVPGTKAISETAVPASLRLFSGLTLALPRQWGCARLHRARPAPGDHGPVPVGESLR
jgi:integrase/recombinase XerD